MGQPFTLALGREAVLPEADLVLRFADVLEDSRCPTQVNCVWAGQARILVGVIEQGEFAGVFEMNTNPPLKLEAFTYAEYEIRLTALNPYPEQPAPPIPLEDYEATFVVSKK